MTQEVAYRFVEALDAFEQRGNLERMLDIFAEGCEIGNALHPEQFHGKSGAREYWNHYRTRFGKMHSTIRNIVTGDDSIAIEWTATATDCAGQEFSHDGVTVLDVRGPQITRFRSYFDTKQLAERLPVHWTIAATASASR
jgi:ketosteroid isomerase-like protein